MPALLFADSGSTKTDWCLLSHDKGPQHCQTSGLNPFLRSEAECLEALKEELTLDPKVSISKIIFYGAGVKDELKATMVKNILYRHFQVDDMEIYSDLLAAARASCGEGRGVVSILGTGSNSGYYNGQAIEYQNPSLGYIIGDEGSGTYLGKRVLQYYFYNTFDDELKASFENKYGNNLSEILHKVYKEPLGNRYLAAFTAFLIEERGHFMVENIIEDAFIDFHQRHILKYRQSWQYPIHFIGSVAYQFRDILLDLHQQFGLETGMILKSPLQGLIDFHQKEIEA